MKQVSATMICNSFHLIFFVASTVLGPGVAGRGEEWLKVKPGWSGAVTLMEAHVSVGKTVKWYSEEKLIWEDATRTL